MSFHYVLFFGFLSAALWNGNTGITVFQKTEGQTFGFIWHFTTNETIKFFCKRECKEGETLIKTNMTTAQNGKYSIEYKETPPTGGFLTANIKQLTKSDSGRYKLGMGESVVPGGYGDFEIRVLGVWDRFEEIAIHSGDEGGQVDVSCLFPTSRSTKYFCKEACRAGNILLETDGDNARGGRYIIKYHNQSTINMFTIRMTITQLTMSDSGRYVCGLGTSLTSASFQEFKITVAANPSASTPLLSATTQILSVSSEGSTLFPASTESTIQFTVLFPLVGCVIVITGLLAVIFLLLCKLKKNTKSDNKTMESVTYENSPPVSTHDCLYETLNLDSKDKDQTYSTLHMHSSHGAV